MSASEITHSLYCHFKDYNYKLTNAYVYAWECDFFCMSKAGYAYEVEIKVSRSDYKADFNKPKHKLFSAKKDIVTVPGFERKKYNLLPSGKVEALTISHDVHFVKKADKLPNRFYYATPPGLLNVEEIPDYAGLIEIGQPGYGIRLVKQAPLVHKQKNDLTKVLLEKFYWKYENMRQAHERRQLLITRA